MATPKQLPPPGFMIPELRTPNPADVFFRELVDRNDARWRDNDPIKRGTLYSSLRGSDEQVAEAYPELYFISETVPIGSNTVAGMTQHNYVIWNWSTVPRAESAYNAEMSFMGDSVSNSVFARVYTVRRDEFDEAMSIDTGTAFTGLIGLKKISGGQNYTKASGTLRGKGDDSGAKVSFVIADGVVISGIIENEGSGFDANSSVDVIGDGTGAQFELILQPPEAILTSQKKLEFPDDDPRQAEFVKVFRVYELLPGPFLPYTRYDDNLGPIQGRKRAVLNTGQQGGVVGPTHYLNYNDRDGSSVVLWELEERFSDGSGSDPSNPTYPILRWSTYEPERGVVDHTSQLVPFNQFSEQASYVRTVFNNRYVVTKTWFEPYPDNPSNLYKKLTDIWTDILVQDFKVSSEHQGGIIEIDEVRGEPGSLLLSYGYLVTDSWVKTLSPNEQIRHNEYLYGLPGAPENQWPVTLGCHTDDKTGIVLLYTKQVIPGGTPVPARSGYRGPFVEDTPYDRWKTIRIITAADPTTLPGPEAWVTTRNFSLPKTLLSVEAIWTDENSYSAEAHSDAVGNNAVKVLASAGSRGGALLTFRNGFRGKARCIVARDFKYGQFLPSEVPTPFSILPSGGSIVFIESQSSVSASAQDGDSTISGTTGGNAFSTAGGMSSASFDQRAHEIDVSDCLVGNFTVLNPFKIRTPSSAVAISGTGQVRQVGLVSASGTWNARMEVRIPTSTPTPEYLAHQPNNQILDDVVLEEWGYGIWVMYRYYIDLTGIL